jgi:hypothetical protein
MLLRTGLWTGFVTLGSAGFVAIGAIFGGFKVEVLRVVRQMLLDFYDFVEQLFNHSPNH